MSWNYRVVKKDGMYAIHEVHYSNGVVIGITEDALAPMGETKSEVIEDLVMMLQDSTSQVIDYEDFVLDTEK